MGRLERLVMPMLGRSVDVVDDAVTENTKDSKKLTLFWVVSGQGCN